MQRHSPFPQTALPKLALHHQLRRRVSRRAGAQVPRCIFHTSRIHLMYGLSEAFRSTYLPPEELDRQAPGSMGKAIPETEILVLDEPARVCAERGRRARASRPDRRARLLESAHREATAAVYRVPTRCAPDHRRARRLLGRSGEERQRWLSDFVGRRDQQIKSHGFRISPRGGRRDPAGLGHCGGGHRARRADEIAGVAIVAHVVPREPDTFAARAARLLSGRMPVYMVPRRFKCTPCCRALRPEKSTGRRLSVNPISSDVSSSLLSAQERVDALRQEATLRSGSSLCDLPTRTATTVRPRRSLRPSRPRFSPARPLDLQYTPYGGGTWSRRLVGDALRQPRHPLPTFVDVVLTPGAMAALNVVFRSVADGRDGEVLVVISPCWLDYPLYLENLGLEAADGARRSADASARSRRIEAALSPRTRAIVLCRSRPIPTGLLYSAGELRQLAELLEPGPVTAAPDLRRVPSRFHVSTAPRSSRRWRSTTVAA